MLHKDLTGEDAVHQAAFVQDTDPGAVGANKEWIDTTDGGFVRKLRSADNTSWTTLSTGDAGPQGDPGVGVPTGGTAGQVLAKASGADYDTEWSTLPDFNKDIDIVLQVDNSGSPLEAGDSGWVRVPFAGTITAAELVADAVGSVSIDVYKAAYADFPTFTKISATAPLALSSAQKTQPALTGWTTAVSAGDYLRFTITGTPDTVTKLSAVLTISPA